MRVIVNTGCLLVLAIAGGCYGLMGAKAGLDVASQLKVGQSRSSVMEVLSQGGQAKAEFSRVRPTSGKWSEVIQDRRVLAALSEAETSTGVTVHEYVQVSRVGGFMGLDVFHLFYSDKNTLVGYVQQHVN